MTFAPSDCSRIVKLAERMGISSHDAVRELIALTEHRSAIAVTGIRPSPMKTHPRIARGGAAPVVATEQW